MVNKGISSYMGVLLLTGLSITAGIFIFQFSGTLSTQIYNVNNPTGNLMTLESAVLTNRELTVYIRNIGKGTIVIDRIYINHKLATEPETFIEINDPGEEDDKILSGTMGTITVQPSQGFQKGKTFTFKIVSTSNSNIEFKKKAPNVAPVVRFTNSTKNPIPGVEVKYYSRGWKVLGTTDEYGEVLLLLDPKSYNFRVTYRGATQQKTQNFAVFPIVEFKTLNTTTKLHGPDGTPVPGATAKYYASGWHTIGPTDETGKVSTELLPMSYNFRMTNEGATLQKTQNILDNPIVQFQTEQVTVRLFTSEGAPVEGATAKYYASGWHTIGTTNENGEVTASLMPMRYNFRISYGGATIQKTQDITINPVVEFNTALVTVKLLESDESPIEGALIRYYASGWNTIGNTDVNGEVSAELMPMSYNFRVTHGGATQQKTQNIGVDPVVAFNTHLVTVSLLESDGDPIEGAAVRYYANGWNVIGATDVNGEVTVELLPLRYRYSLFYGGATTYITSSEPVVSFATTCVTISANDAFGPVVGAFACYSAGGWQTIGYTNGDGEVSMELLLSSYRFRLTYETISTYITQDVNVNPLVNFNLS